MRARKSWPMQSFLSTPSARRATAQSVRLWEHLQHFYPRPPRGGRPLDAQAAALPAVISIHALREEGDAATLTLKAQIENFYPRPPRGGRLYKRSHVLSRRQFLPTPSARRATDAARLGRGEIKISIHALREEGDRSSSFWRICVFTFLSTPSARKATSTRPAPNWQP